MFLLKDTIFFIDLTCILYDAERSSEAPVCDPERDLSNEGVMSFSIAGKIGCLSIKS